MVKYDFYRRYCKKCMVLEPKYNIIARDAGLKDEWGIKHQGHDVCPESEVPAKQIQASLNKTRWRPSGGK